MTVTEAIAYEKLLQHFQESCFSESEAQAIGVSPDLLQSLLAQDLLEPTYRLKHAADFLQLEKELARERSRAQRLDWPLLRHGLEQVEKVRAEEAALIG